MTNRFPHNKLSLIIFTPPVWIAFLEETTYGRIDASCSDRNASGASLV